MKRCVWVVDDNAAVAESVAAVLAAEGIPAVALVSTAAARALLDTGHEPRALVLDLHMPNGGDGLLAEIASRPEWAWPVVVLTGYPDGLRPALRARAQAVLDKAGEPLALVAVVRRALGEGP